MIVIHWIPKVWNQDCAGIPYVLWSGFAETRDGLRLAAQVHSQNDFYKDAPFYYSLDGKGGWPRFPAQSLDEAQTFARWELERIEDARVASEASTDA